MCLVDFDKLMNDAESSLRSIGECIGLRDTKQLTAASAKLRSPTSEPLQTDRCLPACLSAAREVYRRLQLSAL